MPHRLFVTAALGAALAACSPATDDGGGARDAAAEGAAEVSLTRLDCGTLEVADLSVFSVAGDYRGVEKTLTNSCYLIRHGEQLMLWDTGLPGEIAGKGPQEEEGGGGMRLDRTLVEQLAAMGIKPGEIDLVGISHFHFDHTGQLAQFPGAKLLTGAGDWEAITAPEPDPRIGAEAYAHWAEEGGKVEPVSGDHDVFGDGSVVMLALPGHTPGHHGLKVTTSDGKTYLLSGDVAHFHENYAANGVPTWNTDKEASVESIRRFKALAEESGAVVVIQHEPGDIGLVPAAAPEPAGQCWWYADH